MYRYAHKNVRPFSAVCQNNYGRQVIFTRKRQITKNNIIEELNKALVIHEQNAIEIEYLDRYYRGDQPILYRQKVNRPEINNKIAVNLAYELVERKTAEMCAEPIQYVQAATKPDNGMVTNHAITIERATPQLTAFTRLEDPTPIIEPLTTCVVLTGKCKNVAVKMVIAEFKSAAKPLIVSILKILFPIVEIIRHPPAAGPRAIAIAQEILTHVGTSRVSI